MGQRANLIIVEDEEYSLYYSHWCANTITRDLFWGPHHAINFIQIQRKVDASSWLDDIWAEGAAVIDCDNQVLLLFGGEDTRYDVPLRRLYLSMASRVWANWDIRWAYEGIAEVADYVKYPRTKVLTDGKSGGEVTVGGLEPPSQIDWTDLVGSFVLPDGTLQLFPLAGDVASYLLRGPGITAQCARSRGAEFVPLDEWIKNGFPIGGFHIDTTERRLTYWTGGDMPGIPDRVTTMWPGWTVTWQRDNFEWQLDATFGRLRLPQRPKEQLQQQLIDMLLSNYGTSPVDTILEATGENLRDGKDVSVNPWALRDDRLEISLRERERIIAAALGAMHF